MYPVNFSHQQKTHKKTGKRSRISFSCLLPNKTKKRLNPTPKKKNQNTPWGIGRSAPAGPGEKASERLDYSLGNSLVQCGQRVASSSISDLQNGHFLLSGSGSGSDFSRFTCCTIMNTANATIRKSMTPFKN